MFTFFNLFVFLKFRYVKIIKVSKHIIKIISFFFYVFDFATCFSPYFGFIIAQDYDVRVVRTKCSGNFRQFSSRFTPQFIDAIVSSNRFTTKLRVYNAGLPILLRSN